MGNPENRLAFGDLEIGKQESVVFVGVDLDSTVLESGWQGGPSLAFGKGGWGE